MEINSKVLDEAWKYLEDSIVYFQGQPTGTVASRDTKTAILNYDQIFTRDFFVSAIAFLLNNRYDIVKNFLIQSVNLQGIEKRVDCFNAGSALMPASFKKEERQGEE